MYPVRASSILALIDEPFRPASFVDTCDELMSSASTAEPLSCTSLREFWQLINDLFAAHSGEAVDETVLRSIVCDIIEHTKTSFNTAAKRALDELDDVITPPMIGSGAIGAS